MNVAEVVIVNMIYSINRYIHTFVVNLFAFSLNCLSLLSKDFVDQSQPGEEMCGIQECNHFVGFVDIHKRDSKQEMSRMLSVRVPRMQSLNVIPQRLPSMDEDWNKVYQNALDKVLGINAVVEVHEVPSNKPFQGSSFTLKPRVRKLVASVSNYSGTASEMDDGTINSEYSDESAMAPDDAETIQKLLEFQAVMGAFYQSAIAGE